MNNKLPVIGPNVLPPLGEFKVRAVPTLLLEYLQAHGYDDCVPMDGGIMVTNYRISEYNGIVYTFHSVIAVTMPAVREFLGYPA